MRGLPITEWTEENFKELLKDFGEILHYCKTSDEDSFYQTPKFLIDTHDVKDINTYKTVELMTSKDGAQLNDLANSKVFSFRDDEMLDKPVQKNSPNRSNSLDHIMEQDYGGIKQGSQTNKRTLRLN